MGITFINFNTDILIALFRAESTTLSIRCSTRDEPRYTDRRMENQEEAEYRVRHFERNFRIPLLTIDVWEALSDPTFSFHCDFFGSEGFPNYVIEALS